MDKYDKLIEEILTENSCASTGLNVGGRYYVFANGDYLTVPYMSAKEDYEILNKHFNEPTKHHT